MNLCVGTVGNGEMLVVFWAINGFAQALMWPPLVKILSNLLNDDDYKKACVRVSWGSSLGTVSVYLVAPFIIKAFDVRIVFIICGVIAAVMAFVWKLTYDNYKPIKACTIGVEDVKAYSKSANVSSSSVARFNKSSVVLLGLIMVCIMLQGSLRDGVTNWTPTYISEIFNLDSSVSILTGVVLPVFSLLSFTFVSFINRRFIKNELTCAGVTFGVGAVSAVLLLTFGSSNVVLSLVLLALLVGSMHGVNLILVCMIPAHFAKFGKVSFISGLINSCTYAGAAISTYGIAVFTDVFGWNKTIVLWSIVAFLGALICIAISKKWVSFKKA
jgi:OPA family glycerol-3-phosphate transporter-like MFS transporter